MPGPSRTASRGRRAHHGAAPPRRALDQRSRRSGTPTPSRDMAAGQVRPVPMGQAGTGERSPAPSVRIRGPLAVGMRFRIASVARASGPPRHKAGRGGSLGCSGSAMSDVAVPSPAKASVAPALRMGTPGQHRGGPILRRQRDQPCAGQGVELRPSSAPRLPDSRAPSAARPPRSRAASRGASAPRTRPRYVRPAGRRPGFAGA